MSSLGWTNLQPEQERDGISNSLTDTDVNLTALMPQAVVVEWLWQTVKQEDNCLPLMHQQWSESESEWR